MGKDLYEYTGECERCHELLTNCESTHCGWQRVDLKPIREIEFRLKVLELAEHRRLADEAEQNERAQRECRHPLIRWERDAALKRTEYICRNCDKVVALIDDKEKVG